MARNQLCPGLRDVRLPGACVARTTQTSRPGRDLFQARLRLDAAASNFRVMPHLCVSDTSGVGGFCSGARARGPPRSSQAENPDRSSRDKHPTNERNRRMPIPSGGSAGTHSNCEKKRTLIVRYTRFQNHDMADWQIHLSLLQVNSEMTLRGQNTEPTVSPMFADPNTSFEHRQRQAQGSGSSTRTVRSPGEATIVSCSR
jgi:hypothetical protein